MSQEMRYYDQLLFDVALSQQAAWKHSPPPLLQNDLPSLIQPWFEELEPGLWPRWIDRQRLPEYLLVLRTNGSPERLKALEDAYREASRASLWDHVLRKVALTTNTSTYKIVAFMEVYCGAHLIYELEPGNANREGPECRMATARQTIRLRSASLAKPGSERLSQKPVLKDKIDGFFQNFLPKGASLEYLDRQENTIEVIVRDIRGYVIHGGEDWEKIDINVALLSQSNNEAQLNVYVDGSLSSGIGAYPRDSQFTRSMEPDHAQELTSYAKALATSLGAFLEKGIK
jgi:hypothetical protein